MLTPIEKYNNIYFKRDDKFAPYGDVNGGKMRQTIALFEKYKDKIKNEHNNIVLPLVLSVGLQKSMVSIQFLQLVVLNLKLYRNAT